MGRSAARKLPGVATLAFAFVSVLPGAGLAAEPIFDAVIGGTPVASTSGSDGGGTTGPWPSVVALVEPGDGAAADRQFCGATVIAPRWLLTAAHCLYGVRRAFEPADVRVVAGATDLRADVADTVEEQVVTNLFVHPAYDHGSRDAYHDIALIELANGLDAPPVPLFDGDAAALGAAPGTVVGWGAIEFVDLRRAVYPDVLHQARVPLVSRATCNHPISYDGAIGDGQLCAGFPDGGVDACVGDSGGPLFVDTDRGVRQVGVVSFGRDCAQPLFYGIYTDVAFYHDWVAQYVELESPANPTGESRVDEPSAQEPPVEEPVADSLRPDGAPDGEQAVAGGAGGSSWLSVLFGGLLLGRRSGRRRSVRSAPFRARARYMNSERILSKLVWRMSRPLTR